MKTVNSNIFFLICFVGATFLHFPLCSWASHFYFHPAMALKVKPSVANNPCFNYIPPERPVTVTKVNKPVRQSFVQKSVVKDPLPLPKKQVEKSDDSIKKEREPQKKSVLKKTQKSKITEHEQLRTLKPTVENLDLTDNVVREAFFEYYELLSNIISRFAVYPEAARSAGEEGVAYISFQLNKDGSLSEVLLKESSGSSILDGSAVCAIQNAAPFPKLPASIQEENIRLNVPISFEID